MHGDGIVDLLEREGVGDEAVETHFACLDEVNEPWYLEIRGNTAAVGAFEDFFEVERESVNGNLFSRARDSDKNGATIGMGEIVGKLDDAGIAGGIDDNIGSRFSNDLSDFIGEIDAFCGRVECVSEAPLFGHGELGVVKIDADDGMGADHLSGLGDIQPNSTDSENNDTLADFELGIIVDDANSGGDGTAEEWRTAEVES